VTLRSRTKNRILLNLGGIANFTALPKNCALTDVVAFDTGPANMVIDALMMKFFGRKCDAGGETALRGNVIAELLVDLMTMPYFAMRPPKSTGRELFGAMVLPRFFAFEGKASPEDLVATAARWTAASVFDQYKRFIAKRMKAEEIIVSGGGVHNRAVMSALDEYFKPAPLKRTESHGFSADAKEAICFAVLANETISEHPSNVPSATGAKRPVVLGKICL
jgi:anhydro-N-acetylmuramic acid kinase